MNNTAQYTSGSYGVYSSMIEERREIAIANVQSQSSMGSLPLALIGRLDSAGACLKQPIGVLLEVDDDIYIVSEPLFWVYGEGSDPHSALADYKSALVDYAEMRRDHRLDSKEDSVQFEALEKYVSLPR
jgi:hypothetical protein